MNKMQIPKTKIGDDVEEIHGIKIADPYRWLENSSDPEVREWTEEQNKYTDSFLRGEVFKNFSDEIVKNFKFVTFFNPHLVKGVYFYKERQPDENQSVLYMKKGISGNPVKLIDPNILEKNGIASMDFWSPSKTGNYLAYGISKGGDEMATLYVRDLKTNKDLSDTISPCRYSKVIWTPDDSGFFYTRNPDPGSVPANEEHMHTKIFHHILGTDSKDDKLIFGQNRPKDDMITLSHSVDGRYIGIHVFNNWTKNDVYIYDTQEKKIQTLFIGLEAEFSIRFLADKVLVNTNYKANNYRVLSAPINDFFKPVDEWQEFISEKTFVLRNISVTKSKILVEYLVNVCSEVFIFNYSGEEIGRIPLPKYSSISGISAHREEEEFFYSVESFTFPKIIYRFDPDTNEHSVFKKTDNPINPEDYEVKQEWCISKDGTKVPMFIFHKKDILLNGKNPTILYGYGGFGSNQEPYFMRNNVPWLERGGIFAIANIRGGSEFGDVWHKGGIKENKQNSFDDFIAAAEYLISKKYTDSEHLGILGGSNGGLLVAAVATQRPELFKAVCSRVPLTDMVRFPKFGMAARWVHEYGDPAVKEDLERILKWSPYHNVKDGIKYPNFLFTTADKDTRVSPMHARKMTAKLQSLGSDFDGGMCFLFTEFDAGHGPGKPVVKVVESQALVLSFFWMSFFD